MEGGTLPITLMLHLLVTWLCLASAAARPHAAASEDSQIEVKFSTSSATPESYKSFIDRVREALLSKTEKKSHGIPVLISEDDPVARETYVYITLLNKAGHSVSLKMNVTDAYFTGYDAGDYSCVLKRSGGTFSSAVCYTDPRSISVDTLLQYSSRDTYPAGVVAGEEAPSRITARDLDKAVSIMFLFPTGDATEEELGRAIAICRLVIAGAAMSPHIERWMSVGMWNWNGASNDNSLHSLQDRWPELSVAIQESNQGVFADPVTIQRSSGEPLHVDNTRRVVPLLSFLHHYKCKKQLQAAAEPPAFSQQQLPRLLIRTVVPPVPGMLLKGVVKAPSRPGPARRCKEAEPTTRILGPDGMCVDVYNGLYDNGQPIELWPCKSSDYQNQLWTFRRDGTIRSNGKCLTSKGTSPGDSVVIDDCPDSPTERTLWALRDDGNIELARSDGRLVLSASSTASKTVLTVQSSNGGTGQSWMATNDTAPFITNIRGYHDLCLMVGEAAAGGEVVLAASCDGPRAEWALYPDGSVRPGHGSSSRCLAADARTMRVVVSPCDLAGSAQQRFVFHSNGTVSNPGTTHNSGTGRVMDVKPRHAADQLGCLNQQDVDELEVIMSVPTGAPTQKFSIVL